MAYLVLARKWRPQTFNEVVGQHPVTQTLKNALAQDRLAHALLFAGPRGVGKTTTARILAKALNCEQGSASEPCSTCISCQEIAEGRSFNCLEIDAASHTQVEKIRELLEGVPYAAVGGRYKVYIIDEVHMLSINSFNALLKTLEEPPPKVVFVLATTEPHKVPATIHSRCQRYDFRRIGLQEIVGRLQEIATAEGIETSEEVFLTLARAAEGSLRDAQSLLDQVVAYSGPRVGLQEVVEALGLIEGGVIAQAAQAVIDRDGGKLFALVDELFNRGYDLRLFCQEFLGYFRDLLIVKIAEDPRPLLRGTLGDLATLKRQGDRLSVEALELSLQLLSRAEFEMRRSSFPRYVLEMALVRLTQVHALASLGTLVERLSALEARLGGPPTKPQSELDLFTSPPREMARDRIKEAPKEMPREGPRRVSPAGAGTKPLKGKAEEGSKAPRQEADQAGGPTGAVEEPPPEAKSGLEAQWAEVKKRVGEKKPSLASLLESKVREVTLEGDLLRLFVEDNSSFARDALEDRKNGMLLETIIGEVFHRRLKIEYRYLPPPKTGRKRVPIAEHPLVKEALELFEGQIVNVERSSSEEGEGRGG
ncbi:MAG: DNA polymerase III subunit gamma/tau [candidate division NC10 bacterium]|nr:DNA polymerase III subunit gamma/tau [candidate division NC10 bacterium]